MVRTTSLKKKTEDHLEEKEQQTKSIVTHARKLRASMWAVGPGNVFFHSKKTTNTSSGANNYRCFENN